MILLLCVSNMAEAQKYDEWFRQKKTQKQYLLNQVAALQAYIQVAKKGYEISQKGLTTISNIKDGDFNLHRDFFGSMKTINPTVKHYAKVADIISMQQEVVKNYRLDYKGLQTGGRMGSSELGYIDKVYKKLLADCTRIADELIMITTDAQLEMKDDERMQRIDVLYHEMKGNHVFCRRFSAEAQWLAASRNTELNQLETSRAWNGLK